MKLRSHLALTLLSGLLAIGLMTCNPATVPPRWDWERVETGLSRQAILLSVVADPFNPDRLWAGYYGPGGLAMSTDGGQSWTTGLSDFRDNPVFDLLLTYPTNDPQAKIVLWAATRDGLLRSEDAGHSWQTVAAGLPPAPVFALAEDAAGRLYAGLDGRGIYTRPRAGQDWIWLTPSSPSPIASPDGDETAGALLGRAGVLSLAVSPDGRQLYAGASGQGLFASQDGGATWVATYPGEYASNVAFDPDDPKRATASLGDRLVRTVDGGRSWHTLRLDWAEEQVVSLLWLPDGTLGAGTANGQLYYSRDGGDSWTGGDIGLPPDAGGLMDLALISSGESPSAGSGRLLLGAWTGLYAGGAAEQSWITLAPTLGHPNAETLLATDTALFLGARSGLYRWQPNARAWQPAAPDFPFGVASLASDPLDPRILYAGTVSDGIYRSQDAGASWQPLPALRKGIPAVAVDPKMAENIYILAAWERVYESHNGGQSWAARWEGLGDVLETSSLAVDPLEPIVYVGTEFGLYRRRNNDVWQPVAPALADQTVLALAAHPNPNFWQRGSILYIGATRGVYHSLDQGETVRGGPADTGWGKGLENISVTALLVDPADPRRLYAGTAYAGVYQSLDWGKTWQAVGPAGLQETVVESLAWGPDGELFVAAENSVWRGEKAND